MEKMELDGKTYIRRDGEWFDKDYCKAPVTIQRKLNSLVVQDQERDIRKWTKSDLIKEGQKYKELESYQLAINFFEKALEKSNDYDARYIYPMISSCYRKNREPGKAISLYETILKKHGPGIVSDVILTSLAASYCDINEYTKAREYADVAVKMCGGNISWELKHLLGRINK